MVADADGVLKTTDRLQVIQPGSGDARAINFITYELKLVDQGAGDWLNTFDTKIDAGQYTVIVVGSYFSLGNDHQLIRVTSDAGYEGDFGVAKVFADVSGSPATWKLHADYVGATSNDGSSGMWTLYCMIINNALAKDLGTQQFNVSGGTNGGGNGAATAPPPGL